jgi:hypothetical protein
MQKQELLNNSERQNKEVRNELKKGDNKMSLNIEELNPDKILSEETLKFIGKEIDKNEILGKFKEKTIRKIDIACNFLPDIFSRIINYKNSLYSVSSSKTFIKIRQISNFVLKPINCTIECSNCADEEYVEVSEFDLKKEEPSQSSYNVSLYGKDMVDSKTLLLKLSENISGLIFCPRPEDYRELLCSLSDQALRLTKFKNDGYNKNSGCYIWKNAIMTCENNKVYYENKENGLITINDQFYSVDDNVTTILPSFSDEFRLDALNEFITNIINTYDDSVKMVFGAALGIAYYDIFSKYAQGFPFVALFGASQTGKSTLTTCINRVFGNSDNHNILSGMSTPYAIRYNLLKSMNTPVIIDDVEKNNIDKIGLLCKDIFSQIPRQRGKKDGSTETLEVNSGLIFASNYFFSTPSVALLNRGIFANITEQNNKLNDFIYHDKAAQKRLSTILPLLLKYRSKVVDFYNQNMIFLKALEGKGNRYHNNIAIALVTWDILSEITGKKLVDKHKLVTNYLECFKPYLDCDVPFGDEVIGVLASFISRGFIHYDETYVVTKGNKIRLNLTKFFSIYNRIYLNTPLTKSYFQLKLNSDPRFKLKATGIGKIGRAISIELDEDDEILELIQNKERGYYA